MSPRITTEALYQLLPAVHRIRDAREGEPLKALIGVLAREGAVVEEAIEQLYDNLFIETAEDWAVPYIGGTIGYRPLHPTGEAGPGMRAEVANTIPYRRRKGTAAVLEQLAVDVTGWPAKVVEYFLLVATAQHMNHIRPNHRWGPDVRDPLNLEELGGAFDQVTRSVDTRSIGQSPGRKSIGGRHNLPNIGLHLWRLEVMRHTETLTTLLDERRHLFDPLGIDTAAPPRQLINRPRPENEITSLAREVNVPIDISRRRLHADPALWYGPNAPIQLFRGGVPIPVEEIEACDLSDDGAEWNHSPPVPLRDDSRIRIDPVLGRIAFPRPQDQEIRATWHRAFPARIGGGEYDRTRELVTLPDQVPVVVDNSAGTALQNAIDSVQADGGIVEIDSNDIFDMPTIAVDGDAEIVLRAANGRRPILRGDTPFAISGLTGARVVLNGLTIEGAPIVVSPQGGETLNRLQILHCTLIPGLSYTESGAPSSPGAASLRVTAAGVEIEIRRSITGPLEIVDTANTEIADSLVDAAASNPLDSPDGFAITGLALGEHGGAVSMDAVTVIGRVFARRFPLVSNSIFHAQAPEDEIPVRAFERQTGCIRFSYVPPTSAVPRSYRCQPQLAAEQAIQAATEAAGIAQLPADERKLIASRIERWLKPSFTALSSSHPAYAQILTSAPEEIRRGADDESEMGVYHHLFQPQREANLRIRLDEYLRFGLEAGLFFEA